MTRAQALREARRILGTAAYVDFNRRALDAAEKARVLPLPPRPPRSSPDWERWARLAEARNALLIPSRCTIYVPLLGGAGRSIRAEGDTWEEAISRLRGKRA